DLYAKLSYPFAHLIMALVGIPFALQSPRGGRVIGIALCIGLGLTYFLAHSAAVALARTDLLPPIVAAWSAHVLSAPLGLSLFLRPGPYPPEISPASRPSDPRHSSGVSPRVGVTARSGSSAPGRGFAAASDRGASGGSSETPPK